MSNYDAIVIGAGHNGLVTAAYLAKAGKKVLVLERRAIVGGIAATEEIFPGFKFSTCAHLAAALPVKSAPILDLKKHGLELLAARSAAVCANLNGAPLVIPRDPAKAAKAIGQPLKKRREQVPSVLRQT